MRRSLLIAVLLAVVLPAVGHANDSDDQKEIAKLQNQINEAMIKVDISFLNGALADDFMIISPSGDIEDKTKYLRDIKEGNLKYEAIDKSEVKVRVYGDAAVVTGHAVSKVSFKGQAVEGSVSFTDVYSRQGGKWRSVSVQVTRVAAQSGGKP